MRPSGWGVWGRLGGLRGVRRPEQQKNLDALQQEKIDQVLAKQDARYDSMTAAERENYYLKPSLKTRIKKAVRGQ